MLFDRIEEDDFDFEAEFADIELEEANQYIEDGDKALSLLTQFFRRPEQKDSLKDIRVIRKKVDELFALCSQISISNELEYYQKFNKICDRLAERNKIQHIRNRTVISLGGKFSAGKSKFINSISGIQNVLPEAQKPTTSIPTYILSGKQNLITANSIYGYSCQLSEDELKALTHEFYDTYQIGFSSFIESIMVEANDFALNPDIVLLDTPGYTKYDGDNTGKITITDKQRAFEQLKTTDYLIWLVDIDNGALTLDDLDFIESLDIQTPILIVFNKADKKPQEDIKQIIQVAKEIAAQELSTPCYGITAYSSMEHKEYGGNLIQQFLRDAVKSSSHSYDVVQEFQNLENEMREGINAECQRCESVSNNAFTMIADSEQVLEIRSLAELWRFQNQSVSQMHEINRQYNIVCKELNLLIDMFLQKRGEA